MCAPIFIVITGLKLVLETAFRHITPKILAKKYKNTTDEKMLIQGEIYRKKLASDTVEFKKKSKQVKNK